MEVKNMDELRKVLMGQIAEAVDNMAEMVKDGLDNAVYLYYQDYTPKQYERTGNLEKAPSRTGVKVTKDEAVANVYMNTDLQYPGKWDMDDVIKAADMLTHGGVFAGEGVSVWKLPMLAMKKNQKEMWKKAFKDAGLDIE